MPFEYKRPDNIAGEWITMKELAKMGEPIEIRDGFLTDDPTNTYQGDPTPRFIIAATVVSTGDEIKVSVPTGVSADRPSGYGRAELFRQAEAYLKEHPDESIKVKFVKVPGTQYIDADVA